MQLTSLVLKLHNNSKMFVSSAKKKCFLPLHVCSVCNRWSKEFYPLPPADGPVLPKQEFDLPPGPHTSSFAPPTGAGKSQQTCVQPVHNISHELHKTSA